jgi:hypothetical protein
MEFPAPGSSGRDYRFTRAGVIESIVISTGLAVRGEPCLGATIVGRGHFTAMQVRHGRGRSGEWLAAWIAGSLGAIHRRRHHHAPQFFRIRPVDRLVDGYKPLDQSCGSLVVDVNRIAELRQLVIVFHHGRFESFGLDRYRGPVCGAENLLCNGVRYLVGPHSGFPERHILSQIRAKKSALGQHRLLDFLHLHCERQMLLGINTWDGTSRSENRH